MHGELFAVIYEVQKVSQLQNRNRWESLYNAFLLKAASSKKKSLEKYFSEHDLTETTTKLSVMLQLLMYFPNELQLLSWKTWKCIQTQMGRTHHPFPLVFSWEILCLIPLLSPFLISYFHGTWCIRSRFVKCHSKEIQYDRIHTSGDVCRDSVELTCLLLIHSIHATDLAYRKKPASKEE